MIDGPLQRPKLTEFVLSLSLSLCLKDFMRFAFYRRMIFKLSFLVKTIDLYRLLFMEHVVLCVLSRIKPNLIFYGIV